MGWEVSQTARVNCKLSKMRCLAGFSRILRAMKAERREVPVGPSLTAATLPGVFDIASGNFTD